MLLRLLLGLAKLLGLSRHGMQCSSKPFFESLFRPLSDTSWQACLERIISVCPFSSLVYPWEFWDTLVALLGAPSTGCADLGFLHPFFR